MPYASSTAIISTNIDTLFTGLYALMSDILPYAVGILVLYVGIRWMKRAIAG